MKESPTPVPTSAVNPLLASLRSSRLRNKIANLCSPGTRKQLRAGGSVVSLPLPVSSLKYGQGSAFELRVVSSIGSRTLEVRRLNGEARDHGTLPRLRSLGVAGGKAR